MEAITSLRTVTLVDDKAFADIEAELQKASAEPPLQLNLEKAIHEQVQEETPLCVILDETADLDRALQAIQEYSARTHICFFYKRELSPAKLKSLVQSTPLIKGIISTHTPELLACGLRLQTHAYPRSSSKELLDSNPFFENFTSEERNILIEKATFHAFTAGETILDTKDPHDYFFVILKGRAETLIFTDPSNPTIIAVGNGLPLGEMAVIDKSPRSGICIAADETLVIKIGTNVLNLTNSALQQK
jgi:hypothetical protein